MRTTISAKTFGAAAIATCLLLARTTQAAPAASPASGAPASAVKNSFQETTSHLDAGGNFYLYLSTEQFLDGLSGKVSGWRQLLAAVPDINGADRDTVNKVFDVVVRVIKDSGLEDVSGVGMSSVAVEKGVYRNKLFLHHYTGKGKGFLWTLAGQKPHPLAELDLLPANTALALSSDFDIPLLWSVIRDEAKQSGFPEAGQFVEGVPAMFEQATGLKWDQALASLGGEFGVALTLDDLRKVGIPAGGNSIQIPEPGLMFFAKVNDDTVFNRLASELQKQGGERVVSADTATLKMRTMQLPVPMPFPLRPTVALSGGYLFIATTDALVQEAVAVKAGQKPGLKTQPEFKRLAKDLPTQGNGFSFLSERFGKTLVDVQNQALANEGGDAAPVRALMSLLQSEPNFGYSVSANTDDGNLVAGNANYGQGKAILLAATVVPVAVGGAMLLPALSRAKTRAQQISCINNLKQIGLAARVWAVDNNDKFPPTFLAMKEELSNPKILICPQDTAHQAAADWASFKPDQNCSFEYFGAVASETEPTQVLCRCRIHGTVCLVDGSVQQVTGSAHVVEENGKLFLRR